ncbi:SDR family oxidoreductase [Psychrosphaera sp. F3M07]|uniref:SDR family oxidoreductase n=1 Tax=Psychrosphaera sp. F3M07 TaxID=2841560 RepID=UPI001C09C811|nr:SDR family NAD(P)-dependent oxidoreductase [Psychrosphaera sp. F3M07]MBU2918817.1 SDR family oxidoreductase [Psychrosphaera sp. F3M07]
MKELKGKNIIVTGATSGIGRALTEKLLSVEANVAFCGRSKDKMNEVLLNVSEVKGQTLSDTFDIADPNNIIHFVVNAISTLGEIDILVNCAGLNNSRAQVKDININDLEWMLNINLIAPFVFMQETYNKSMKEQREGMIINVMSTVCNFANEGIGAYTASKSGFDALTKVFRKEVRESGVKVCSIYPGGVDTPFRDSERPLYLQTSSVVNSILHMMVQDENSCVDELVLRPIIEKNYC